MHVFHIMAGRANGGAETYCADLLSCLAKAGVKQTAILSNGYVRAVELAGKGIDVRTGPLSLPLIPLQRLRIAQTFNSLDPKPDIVHAWMRRGSTLVPAGLGCPVMSWSGGYYPVDKLARVATHFVGNTPDILRHFHDSGVAEGNTSLQTTFPMLDTSQPAVDRAALDTPADAPLLLVLARLHWKKGLDTLLKSLVPLPEYYLWLAGDGELDAELRALAASLGVADRVRFLGWRTDRAALLGAADMLVVPSRFEPFGTVLLEGWAMRKPVVATAWPHTVVEHEKTGLVMAIDDGKALTAAIRRAWEDKALAARLVATAHAEYEAKYSPDVSTKRMISLYETLIGRQKAQSAST
jgi:glycosyltransferase involved in cell wall biosynthesis